MSSNCDSCFSLKLVGPTEQRLHFCRYEVLAGAAWCSWGLGPGVYWGPLRGQAGTGGGWGPGQSLQLQRHTCAGPPHTQQPRPTVSKHKATRIISNPTTIIIGNLWNAELDTLQFFRFGAADSYDYFERGTSSKTSSFAGVAGGSFTLIGSVGSWQSEFKVVTFCRAKLQS